MIRIMFFSFVLFWSTLFSQSKSVIKKLPISTIYSEISTYLDSGNLFVYRNKPYYKTDNGFYDLFTVMVNKENIKGELVRLDDEVNSRYNEGSLTVNKDKNLVYVTRNKYSKRQLKRKKLTKNILEIVIYKKNKGGYEYVGEFPFNNESYSVGHPSYSSITKRLYFSSENPLGFGKADLYYTTLLPDGSYKDPINLGTEINTEKNEYLPHANNGILYFSSDGRIQDKTDLNIYGLTELGILRKEEPVDIGNPFNSSGDDLGIVLIDNKSGYISSNRNNDIKNNHDIYYFEKMNPVINDDEVNLLLVIDSSKIPFSGFNDIVVKKEKNVVNGKRIKEGLFFERISINSKLVVSYPNKYNFKKEQIGPLIKTKLNDVFIEKELELSTNPLIVNTKVEISNESINNEENKRVLQNNILSVDNIYFKFDSDQLYDESKRELDRLITNYLVDKSLKTISIIAHTDSRGSQSYNLNLSARRANAIKAYINSRISNVIFKKVLGAGSKNPAVICDPCSNEQHKLNRRITFVFEK